MNRSALWLTAPFLAGVSLLACESTPPEPKPKTTARSAEQEAPPAKMDAETAGKAENNGGDPMGGQFSLEDATEGLEGEGELHATIATSLGDLECKLYDERAPVTVANFVGLARGLRPFRDEGKWVKRPAYDGTTFHRVIKGFMIQGGDPDGTGRGEPGYVIPDEIWEGAKHDERGLLCMANRGPDTNGMQFFITDDAAPHLDRSYTIFGKCGPDETIEKLASVKTYGTEGKRGGKRDRPLDPPKIKSVTITRK